MDRTIIELGLSPAFLLLPTLLVCVVTVVAGVITGRRSSRAAAAARWGTSIVLGLLSARLVLFGIAEYRLVAWL